MKKKIPLKNLSLLAKVCSYLGPFLLGHSEAKLLKSYNLVPKRQGEHEAQELKKKQKTKKETQKLDTFSQKQGFAHFNRHMN